jgi:hypothetical protein
LIVVEWCFFTFLTAAIYASLNGDSKASSRRDVTQSDTFEVRNQVFEIISTIFQVVMS